MSHSCRILEPDGCAIVCADDENIQEILPQVKGSRMITLWH